jgi:hypothetical protein
MNAHFPDAVRKLRSYISAIIIKGLPIKHAEKREIMDKDQIIEKISEHIKTRGGLPGEWYVGISGNPERRLSVNHKVDLEKDKWIYIPVNSDLEAREIEEYFVNRIGTDGGRGGGDNGARKVYAYKKAPHTEP